MNTDLVYGNYKQWHCIFKTDVIRGEDEESSIIFNNILRNIVLHNREYIIYGESYIIPSNIV